MARSLWTASNLGCDLPRYAVGELAVDRRRLAWLDDIARFGVAVVSEVPPTVDGLSAVAGSIGIMEANNYGVDWSIVTERGAQNPVDSEIALRVHTDLPYRRQPPGLQLLLAAAQAATGGDTKLVDGHALAEHLRAEEPHTWRTLTTVDRTFAWIRPDQRYVGGGPIIGTDRGDPVIIRHAPDLILPLREGDADAADAAHARFVELAASAAFEYRIRLDEGDLLVLDNHRVLHGRTSVDASSGDRVLLGCYLAADEVDSARRVLRHRLGS